MTARVRVPATSANLGPGFDCLGLALSMYNILEFEERPQGSIRIEVSGEGVDEVPRTPEYNLAYRGFARYFERRGKKPPGVRLHLNNSIPITRGLGSSATAIVSGLYAASLIDGKELPREELMELAVDIEGHPDNVAPAVYGGFVVSGLYGGEPGSGNGSPAKRRLHALRFHPPQGLTCVVAVPSFMLSTGVARRVLPGQIPFADAVQNVRGSSLIVAALAKGDLDLIEQVLSDAMVDALHQPFRLPLIKGGAPAIEAARRAGAFAVTISGSGPSLIAFTRNRGLQVGDAMRQSFASSGVSVRILQLKPETAGIHLI